MAVGLVSAVSSATVAVGASLLFCGPAAPWQCLTPRKARVQRIWVRTCWVNIRLL